MAVWNPDPTRTSCLIIDGGATIIVPKAKPFNNPQQAEITKKSFNNFSEIIIRNGTLKFEDLDSYSNESTGFIRISPIGKLIILNTNNQDFLSLVSDCGVGAKIEVFNADQSESTIYTLTEQIDGDHALTWAPNR